MPGLLIIPVIVAVAFWILASSSDRNRIAKYIQERGGRVVSIAWAPFGKGWFGEKNDRIYEVVYYDSEGNQHFASCKTSMWSGVYWTEDRITHRKSGWYASLSPGNEPGRPVISQIPKSAQESEAEELIRLRAENEELRGKLGLGVGAEETMGEGVPSDGMPAEVAEERGKCAACGGNISENDGRCPHCQIALR